MSLTTKKTTAVLLILALAFILLLAVSMPALAADTWDGSTAASWVVDADHDGTQAKPYEIATGAQLAYLAQQVNAGTAYADDYFVLTADIDLDDNLWTPIGQFANGGADLPFEGNFDGKGFTVSGLSITARTTDNNNYGLFGHVSAANINNLRVEGTITMSAAVGNTYAGGLVGYVVDNSIISNCSSAVDVTVSLTSGYVAVVGSLVGDNESAAITNCYATGDAAASGGTNNYAGGLVGRNNGGTVSNSYWNSDALQNIGNPAVAQDPKLGIGYDDSAQTTTAMTANQMKSWDFIDTLNANVAANNADSANTPWFYWTLNADLNNGLPVFLTGFSGSGTSVDPYLIHNNTELALLAELINNGVDDAAYNNSDIYYQLADDFRQGSPVKPYSGPMIVSFQANLNGNNQTVDLDIDASGDAGLFVSVGADAVISNLSVSGSVTGGDYVGGLVGDNHGTISNCSSSVAVGTNSESNLVCVGSLVGRNNGGTVSNCYATGAVSASAKYERAAGSYAYAGGLVGLNQEGTISNCYAVGAVSASAEDGVDDDPLIACAGGLVGENYLGTISNCYWNSDALQTIDDTPRAAANRGVGNEGDSIPGGDNDATGIITAMTADAMQSQTFVDTLNANRSPDHQTDWLQWQLPDAGINDGFPIFGADAKPDDKKNNSQDTKQPIAFTEPDADDNPTLPLFSDISGHWAEEVILTMAGQGIISGYPDGTFRPENNITRAEFLTLLMRTLKPEPTGAWMVAQFDDIESNAYYYNDLLKAKAMGITKGDGQNNFHPDEPITREEMFTMTYRALETLGQLPEVMTMEFIVFSDWDDVSEYATDPLQVLAKLKLIEGSNNAINPLANAKRAEAAQFFFNILGYLAQ